MSSKHIIYKDNDKEISIDKNIHEFFEQNVVKFVESPTGFEKQKILYGIAHYWESQKVNLASKKFIVAANCPLIEFNKGVNVSAPFDIFECELDMLSVLPPNWEGVGIETLNEEINKNIQNNNAVEQKFYCRLFKEQIGKIAGYLTACTKDEILVLLFGHETELSEDESDFLYL